MPLYHAQEHTGPQLPHPQLKETGFWLKRVWNLPFQARSAEAAVVGQIASLRVQDRHGDKANVLAAYARKDLSMQSAKMMSR